jgi:diguanylate cyclase (GGDEF)-like protein/PAS domain S-box-containing protein
LSGREEQHWDPALRDLIERVPAIFFLAELGAHGRWRYVSPQIESILGFSAEEWMADPTLWERQLHPEDREYALSFESERYLGADIATPAEYRMLTRSGDVVWVLEDAKLIRDQDGTPVWHGVMYDITERKQIEQDYRRLADQQAIIADLGERAVRGEDPRSLMEIAAHLLGGAEGLAGACVWLAPDQRGPFELVGGPPELEKASTAPAGERSHVAAVARNERPLTISDWREERRFELPEALAALGVRSTVAVRIESGTSLAAVLELHSREPGRFAPQDVHFVQSAANVLASAIERRDAEEALRYRAVHDPLTNLPNRELFTEVLERKLRQAARSGATVAVIFLDIDNFKLINDGLGHQTGDELLRKVADRLAARLRGEDVVARFGGDEFAIVLDDLRSATEAAEVAQRLRAELARPVVAGGVEHFLTVSIGIALATPSEEQITSEDLLREADLAMYGAKERGRDTFEIYEQGMSGAAAEQMEIQRGLRDAGERGELELHYQPIIGLARDRVVALEALVRWRHPRRGLLTPAEFVPIAEQSGAIDSLGRWVLEEACAQAAQWPSSLAVSVNIASRQITHHDLHASVLEVLERTGLEPSRLELEITEGVLLEHSEPVASTLEALAGSGIRVFLDDFGTGYSALAYLDRFKLAGLKIDRSFVERLGGDDAHGIAIVEAIIAMAKALGLEIVAEGVDDERQLQTLRQLGCDRAQGYLISAPLDSAEAVRRELAEATEPAGSGSRAG